MWVLLAGIVLLLALLVIVGLYWIALNAAPEDT